MLEVVVAKMMLIVIVVVDSSFKLYYCSLSTVCMSCFLGLLGSELDR